MPWSVSNSTHNMWPRVNIYFHGSDNSQTDDMSVSQLTMSFKIFFRWNGEGDAIQALKGEKGDLILRRKWMENNKGDTQRKEEGGIRHTKKSRWGSNRNNGQLQNLPEGEQSFWLTDSDFDNQVHLINTSLFSGYKK